MGVRIKSIKQRICAAPKLLSMGETADKEKNEIEKKDKENHKVDKKEENGGDVGKDKKKKKEDKECEGKEDKEDGAGKEKKKKNHEDKNDPTKLRAKLEKIDAKMQALNQEKEEILKLLQEVEKTATQPNA